MSQATDDLLQRAKALPPADRARLVGEILATLDEPDAAWRDEVERRVDAADRGERSSTDWTEARRRLGL